MKLWKLIISSFSILCIFLSCEQETTSLMNLRYDKEKNMLLIDQMESARTLKRIDLDLQQDTLVISKIVKKLVPFYGEKSVRKTVNCIVKLPSNVEFVKLGDTLYKLSEMNEFSYDKITEDYNWGVIIVFPKKFPFTIE